MKETWQELSTRLWLKGTAFFAEAGDKFPFPQPDSIQDLPPQRTSMPERDLFAELSHMLFMLGIIFLVLLILLWLSKRFLANKMGAATGQEGNMQLIERHTLSMKSTLYLVEVAGETWLIGESPTSLTSFGRVDLSESKDESHELTQRSKDAET